MSAGEIKLGKVKQLFSIDYPGVIRDQEKALKTLGGFATISKTYLNEETRLELRFRPDDVYCKAAYATRYPTNAVLLRVKRKRNKKTGEMKLFPELVGVIDTTYRFNTMMDYQYLTMERTGDKYKSLMGLATIEKLESIDWMNHETPMHVIPPIFSPQDVPYAYHFREEEVKQPADKQENDKIPTALFGTARKRRPNFNYFVAFDDDVPEKCMPQALAKINTVYMRQKLKEMQQLFEERPIWSRGAISGETDLDTNKLKVLLPCVAYNVTTGPWRTMWIRYGYDPKLHPEAKHFQLHDYRYRPNIKGQEDLVFMKRSYTTYVPSITRAKPKLLRSDRLEYLSQGRMQVDEEKKQESRYVLEPGTLPPHRQMFYQMCDLRLPAVQAILCSNDGWEGPCDKQNGFIPKDNLDRIREAVKQSIMDTQKKFSQNEDEDQGERFDRGWNADQADDSDPDYDPNILETYR